MGEEDVLIGQVACLRQNQQNFNLQKIKEVIVESGEENNSGQRNYRCKGLQMFTRTKIRLVSLKTREPM